MLIWEDVWLSNENIKFQNNFFEKDTFTYRYTQRIFNSDNLFIITILGLGLFLAFLMYKYLKK